VWNGTLTLALALSVAAASACGRTARDTGAGAAQPPPAAGVAAAQRPGDSAAGLGERLAAICARAGGDVGAAVIHVESGEEAAFGGERQLPLYSVFKLPLAVAVLREVEAGRLRPGEKVRVTPEEIVPGWRGNTDLWREPVERTVAELLELSIARSDNTSSDKLLSLVGGPAAAARLVRSLGLNNITIQSTVREYVAREGKNNTGAARDLARLLALLQKGEVLGPPQAALLLGMMERATTGGRRLRGALPAGTRVADKTGTGEDATNDVGLITLPGGRGHLAMAVLISGSNLSAEEEEKLIAELARAAYDAHAARPTQAKQ
jgi:beta-lactamase class A